MCLSPYGGFFDPPSLLWAQQVSQYTECMTDRNDISLIQADFDRLAAFSTEEWDHNSHYHRFLLRHVPPHCSQA